MPLTQVRFLLLALAAGSACAQQSPQAESIAGTPYFSCTSAGDGDQYLRVCVSDRGNVTRFESPKGKDHLHGLQPGKEGYAVCYEYGANSSPVSYDAGAAQGGWWPPTITQAIPNKFPLTVVRNTTDNALQLKQTFTWDTVRKELLINVILRNISGVRLSNVRLERYFDANVDGVRFSNVFNTTGNSVTAQQLHGFMLTALSDIPTTAVHYYYDDSEHPGSDWHFDECYQRGTTVPTRAGDDFVGRISIHTSGAENLGGIEAVTYSYRRY